jgi:YD repeat-containing protein
MKKMVRTVARLLLTALLFGTLVPFTSKPAVAALAADPSSPFGRGPISIDQLRRERQVTGPFPEAVQSTAVKPTETSQGIQCRSAFVDVPVNDKVCIAVEHLRVFGVVNGNGDGTFTPGRSVTRAEMAKMLVLSLEKAPEPEKKTLSFPDVQGHWAYTRGYLQAAHEMKAIIGYPNGDFRPENPVTRGEVIKMVMAALGYAELVDGSSPYTDLEGRWFRGWVQIAHLMNIVGDQSQSQIWLHGKAAPFNGDQAATRAEVAQVLFSLPVKIGYRNSFSSAPWTQYLQGVNMVQGHFTRTDTDAQVMLGKGPAVQIRRIYHSFGDRSGAFGDRWSFGYDIRLETAVDNVTITFPGDRRATFTRQPDGSFQPGRNVYDHLRQEGDRYVLRDRSHTEYWFRPGDHKLQQIVDRHKQAVTFEYVNGRLDQIRDASDRTFSFKWGTYNGADRITAIWGPTDRFHWGYQYDDRGLLLTVIEPDQRRTFFEYEGKEVRLSARKGPVKEGAVRSDPAVETALQLRYDLHGRVSWQREYKEVARRFAYSPLERYTSVTYEDKQGLWESFHYDAHLRLARHYGLAFWTTRTYNDDGDDLPDEVIEGTQQTVFKYDTRGNITEQSVTLDRSKQTKATTTWTYHPHFNLPVRITAGPEQLTTREFDDTTGDLKWETVNGQTTSFAYFPWGGLKLRVDPRSTDQNPMQTAYTYDQWGIRKVLPMDSGRPPCTITMCWAIRFTSGSESELGRPIHTTTGFRLRRAPRSTAPPDTITMRPETRHWCAALAVKRVAFPTKTAG